MSGVAGTSGPREPTRDAVQRELADLIDHCYVGHEIPRTWQEMYDKTVEAMTMRGMEPVSEDVLSDPNGRLELVGLWHSLRHAATTTTHQHSEMPGPVPR